MHSDGFIDKAPNHNYSYLITFSARAGLDRRQWAKTAFQHFNPLTAKL